MRRPVPITGIVGLLASAAAIGLWAAEQLTGNLTYELLTIPAKLALLAAPFFFISKLSEFLHGRPRVAVGLGLTLVMVTLGAMLAYLPWRQSFTEHFSNDVYRWYFNGMPRKHNGFYGDFTDWQRQWAHHIPHAIEAGLALAYHGFIIAICALRRWSILGGAAIAAAGYAMLLFVPMLTGLIVWDYDTFLKGIAFDSISMDLFPGGFWHAGDYSIFLYVFMLIFLGITTTFFYACPRKDA